MYVSKWDKYHASKVQNDQHEKMNKTWYKNILFLNTIFCLVESEVNYKLPFLAKFRNNEIKRQKSYNQKIQISVLVQFFTLIILH